MDTLPHLSCLYTYLEFENRVAPIEPGNFFERGAPIKLSVMLLHSHTAITVCVWGSLVKSQGLGWSKGHALGWTADLLNACLYRGLSLSFKAQGFPQIEGGGGGGCFNVWIFLRFTDVSLPDVFRGPGASVHMLSRSPVSLTPDPSLSCTYSVLYVF